MMNYEKSRFRRLQSCLRHCQIAPDEAKDKASCLAALPGFTLVELLVAIAILSALMAMLLPSIQSGLEMSRSLDCMNRQRQFFVAAQMYANDYRYLPPSYWSGANFCSTLSSYINAVPLDYRKYGPAENLWLCPKVPFPSAEGVLESRGVYSWGYTARGLYWTTRFFGYNGSSFKKQFVPAGLVPSGTWAQNDAPKPGDSSGILWLGEQVADDYPTGWGYPMTPPRNYHFDIGSNVTMLDGRVRTVYVGIVSEWALNGVAFYAP